MGLIAIAVLLLIMNWFFHRVYWSEWIGRFHRRRRELLADERRGFFSAQVLGLALLGLTSVYREGFETVLFLQSLELCAGTVTVLEGAGLGLAATFARRRLHLLPPAQAALQEDARRHRRAARLRAGRDGRADRAHDAGHGLAADHAGAGRRALLGGAVVRRVPDVETLGAQVVAFVFVIGSYFVAQEVKVKRPRRRRRAADPPRRPRPRARRRLSVSRRNGYAKDGRAVSRRWRVRVRRAVGAGVVLATLAAGAAQAATPELSIDQRSEGPARGRGGDPGAGARVPGRPVLRERLAHHGGDGRHRHAAAEAARLRLVPRQRHVGRARDGVHVRRGLRALRAPVRRRDRARAHRRRAGRPARRAARAQAHQPEEERADGERLRRRPLRADDAVPVGLRGHRAQRERQRAGHGRVPRRPARLQRHRGAPGRGARRTPTRRSSARTARRGQRRGRPGPLRPVRRGRVCAAGQPQPMPSECDDGPVRQRHGRPAALPLRVRRRLPDWLWVAAAGSENSPARRAPSSQR